MMSVTRAFLGVAVVLAVIAAVCYFAGKDEMSKIVIGYQPSTHQVAAMIAFEKGWWQRDLNRFGIEEVEMKMFPSGPPEMNAMRVGDIDVAYVGTAPPIAAMYEGLDAKIVAGVQVQGSAIVVRTDIADEYHEKGIEALRGRKIATYPPGSIQHTILSKYLRENGIDPDKDVHLLSQSPSEAASAIAAGDVDAVFLPSPWPAKIALDGSGVIVEWSGDILKDHGCCCLAVRGSLLREHPEIVKQIIRTHINATEYAIEHPKEAAEIFAKWQHENVSVIMHSLEISDMRWIHDPHLLINSSMEYARVIYDLNRERYEARNIEPLQPDDIFDTSLYDEIVSMNATTPTITPPTPSPTQSPTPAQSPTPTPAIGARSRSHVLS